MIFHVSNLNTRVLDPPTHSHQLDTNCWKIRYVFEWPLKTKRPSFCLIKTFSMHWMIFSVCYLGCMVVNINVFFVEWRINERDYFRYCCLGFFLAWNPLFIFRYAVMGTFHVLVKSPQLQTCSADCTEGSCSSNIPSNF